MAVKHDKKYRNKEYATKLAIKGKKWFDKYRKPGQKLIWSVHKDNKKSISLAEKLGFTFVPGSEAKNHFIEYEYIKK